jgi:hypothetical protein
MSLGSVPVGKNGEMAQCIIEPGELPPRVLRGTLRFLSCKGLCVAGLEITPDCRRSMCMMTSNVFGHIAAGNLGYGKVELQRTIAEGYPECRVVVYLRPTAEPEKAEGREYQRSIDE